MILSGRKKFLVSYFAIGASRALDLIRPVVLIPIIARGMGKDSYGIWGQISVTALILSPSMTLRLMTALTRFLPGHEDNHTISRCYLYGVWIVALTSAFVAGVAAIVPNFISQLLFGNAGLTEYVWPAVGFFSSNALFGMLVAYHTAVNKQIMYAIHRTIFSLGGLIMVWFVAMQHDVKACINAVVIWQFICSLIILGKIVILHGWAWPSVKGFPGLWSYAMWTMLSHWVMFLAMFGGRYVVVGLLGLGPMAVYLIAYQVASVISLTSAPNDFVLTPMVSAYWNRNQPAKARPIVRLAYLVIAIMGFPAMAVLIQLGQPLILLLSKKDCLPPKMLLVMLTAATLANGFQMISTIALRMAQKLNLILYFGVGASALGIGSAFLLIPTLDLFGAGLGYFLTALAATFVIYRMSVPIYGVGLDWVRTGKSALLGVVVYLAMEPIHHLSLRPLQTVIFGAAVALVVWVAGFFLLRIYRIRELQNILKRARGETGASTSEISPNTPMGK
ncbi:MAG: lipopolysaccharide biosynthesis protein [Phycisphaerae bacterium]|nr:lipopolysaccharide biosynthesis protein [Phycisphaerae bacterium]